MMESRHPMALPGGAVSALVLAVAGGLETIGMTSTYTDHGWAWYVFGADLVLLAVVIVRAFRQTRVNQDLQRQLDASEKHREEIDKRLGQLEGVARERGDRIKYLIGLLNVMRERTIILRDCDEDHESRIQHIEDRFRLAHDRAVARVALRGSAFDEASLQDQPTQEGEKR